MPTCLHRPHSQTLTAAVKGLLSLSQTALKGMQLASEEAERQENYNNEVDAHFNNPEEGYELGEYIRLKSLRTVPLISALNRLPSVRPPTG